ncbi:hypothetical protein [Pseudoalteromonas byunsanensis]|nr:hypothetical protein [Pseudoalteromonas byunsanensis]OHU94038.1 hypothetical protein BIW53_17615 [Pseudoalteromonas byunsanensis]
MQLGKDKLDRQARYRALFDDEIPSITVDEIKTATDKMWVLGNDKFKKQVEAMAGRRASPLPKGGDRKSVSFINARK